MPAPPSIQPLILVTDGGPSRLAGALVQKIEAALRGARGAIGAVQLREAQGDAPIADDELIVLLRDVRSLCDTHGAKLIVNRRADLVRSGLADGVQLGSPVAGIAESRASLPAGSIIGYSAHSAAEASEAARAGADLILLAPIFDPISKTSSGPPLGATVLAETARNVEVPLFALGGIDVGRVKAVAASRATGIAAISAFMSHPDLDSVERAARRLADNWFSAVADLRA